MLSYVEYSEDNDEGKREISYEIKFEYEYVYDKEGRLVKKVKYAENSKESLLEEWEYDESGNLIRHCSPYGYYDEETWEYDSDGNMLTCTKREGKNIVEYIEYITLAKRSVFEEMIDLEWGMYYSYRG